MSEESKDKHDLWDALPRPGTTPQPQQTSPSQSQHPAPTPGARLEVEQRAAPAGQLAPEGTEGPGGEGPGGQPKPPIRIKAIPPPPEQRGIPIGKIALICLLAVGIYGGYYGYCRYQAGVKVKALADVAHGIRQALLHIGVERKRVTREDIKDVVEGYAKRADVEVERGAIQPTIEPLTSHNVTKLPKVAAMAMGIAMGIPKHQQPNWLVGFKAEFVAKHGVCKIRFEHARYSYLEGHLSTGQ